MSVAGQRVLVTGASSGLGRAVSERLAHGGATVLATARREARLLELAKAHPNVEPHALDLTDGEALGMFCARLGRLDGAILNAGVTDAGPFLEGSSEGDHAMIATNVSANLQLARALHAQLSGGRLVVVGSMAGFVPVPYQAVYSGTKAFVQNWALALREEWRDDVSVGLFAPGGIRTEMTEAEALRHLDRHLSDVGGVADALIRFYGGKGAMHVPGGGNRVAAALSRLVPAPGLARMMERIYRRP